MNKAKQRNGAQTAFTTHNSVSQQKQPGLSQSVIEKKQQAEDNDSDFEEPPEQRAILKSLANIPGISATDSMSYRIEALRVHLENQMGDVLFIQAYKHLVVSTTYFA